MARSALSCPPGRALGSSRARALAPNNTPPPTPAALAKFQDLIAENCILMVSKCALKQYGGSGLSEIRRAHARARTDRSKKRGSRDVGQGRCHLSSSRSAAVISAGIISSPRQLIYGSSGLDTSSSLETLKTSAFIYSVYSYWDQFSSIYEFCQNA